jgi:hypothetical protein
VNDTAGSMTVQELTQALAAHATEADTCSPQWSSVSMTETARVGGTGETPTCRFRSRCPSSLSTALCCTTDGRLNVTFCACSNLLITKSSTALEVGSHVAKPCTRGAVVVRFRHVLRVCQQRNLAGVRAQVRVACALSMWVAARPRDRVRRCAWVRSVDVVGGWRSGGGGGGGVRCCACVHACEVTWQVDVVW